MSLERNTLITQRLRDMFSELEQWTSNDLHNELLEIERKLQIPLTTPSEWGSKTPEQIADYQNQERTR